MKFQTLANALKMLETSVVNAELLAAMSVSVVVWHRADALSVQPVVLGMLLMQQTDQVQTPLILQSLVALVSLNEWLVVSATHWTQTTMVALVALDGTEAVL
jgi:hypothetical protein